MIAAKSEEYQAFDFTFAPTAAKWTVVVGAARSTNGTVDMAYVAASGSGAGVEARMRASASSALADVCGTCVVIDVSRADSGSMAAAVAPLPVLPRDRSRH